MTKTKLIATLEQIQKIAQQIAQKFQPQRIILFGSYARGNPTSESDVDLLVVMDVGEKDIGEITRRIYESFDPPLWSKGSLLPARLEVHIMKPDEFEGSLLRRGVFVTNIAVEGVVIYEAEGVVPISVLLSRQRAWGGPGMKPETKEWVEKAEDDWGMVQRLMQPPPFWDGVCFHAQQCAEKYLKAFLEEHSILFPKTYDLAQLLDLSGGLLSELVSMRSELERLSVYAVIPRYRGFRADQRTAKELLGIAERVREVVRHKLGLSGGCIS